MNCYPWIMFLHIGSISHDWIMHMSLYMKLMSGVMHVLFMELLTHSFKHFDFLHLQFLQPSSWLESFLFTHTIPKTTVITYKRSKQKQHTDSTRVSLGTSSFLDLLGYID